MINFEPTEKDKKVLAAVRERSAENRDRDSVYLLTDPFFNRLAGNLSGWPEPQAQDGQWIAFGIETTVDGAPQVHRVRALTFVLRGQFRLLVGRDVHAGERLPNRDRGDRHARERHGAHVRRAGPAGLRSANDGGSPARRRRQGQLHRGRPRPRLAQQGHGQGSAQEVQPQLHPTVARGGSNRWQRWPCQR